MITIDFRNEERDIFIHAMVFGITAHHVSSPGEFLFHWPSNSRTEVPKLEPRPLFLEFRRSVRVAFPTQTAPAPEV